MVCTDNHIPHIVLVAEEIPSPDGVDLVTSDDVSLFCLGIIRLESLCNGLEIQMTLRHFILVEDNSDLAVLAASNLDLRYIRYFLDFIPYHL